MLVKIVEDIITTNTAGQVVESIPVLPTEEPVQNAAGQWVSPIEMVEDERGVPIRIVDEAVVLNSVGSPVAATPGKGVGVSYSAEATAIFAAMTGVPPTTALKTAINNFIVGMNEEGLLATFDSLADIGLQDEVAAKINWISPGTYNWTETGDPLHIPFTGWQGDGVDGRLLSGFVPGSGAVKKWQGNNHCWFFDVVSSEQDPGVIFGEVKGADNQVGIFAYVRWTDDQSYIYDWFSYSQEVLDARGLWLARRVNGTEFQWYRSGAIVATQASINSNYSRQLTALSGWDGVTTEFSTGTLRLLGYGAAPGAPEIAAFDALVGEYKAATGISLVVAIGDSYVNDPILGYRTWGFYAAEDTSDAMLSMLGSTYGGSPVPQTSTSLLANYPTLIAPQYNADRDVNVLAFIAPSGDGDGSGEETIAAMLENIQDLIDLAKADGWIVVVGTLPAWDYDANPGNWTVTSAAERTTFNAGVLALNNVDAFVRVDLDPHVGTGADLLNGYFFTEAEELAGPSTFYVPHPNAPGHRGIGQLFATAIALAIA